MTADEASLEALSKILSEFYSGSVDAERRLAIQNTLTNYEQTPTAWYSALYYIHTTSEKCVALYSLGVIERTVLSRWSFMKEEEKTELLRVLRFYLFERFARPDSSFLAKKTAQVLTLMACVDGVQSCLSLFEDVKSYLLACLQNRDFFKVSVALNSLKIITEQITDPCEVIGSTKTSELLRWFITESVTVNGLLSRALLFLLDEDTINRVQALLHHSISTENASNLPEVSYIAFQLQQTLIGEISNNSTGRCGALIAWLECLIESFKRLSFDPNFLATFCDALFLFSLVGSPAFMSTYSTGAGPLTNNHSLSTLLSSVCLNSLTCVQEIVDRKNLSPEMIQRSLLNIFPILQYHLSLTTGDVVLPWCGTNDAKQQTKPYNKNLAEAVAADTQSQTSTVDYQMKLIDILKAVMTNFFCQIFSSPDLSNAVGIDPLRFLALLHKFTFSALDLDIYLSSLSLWNAFLEFLSVRYSSGSDSSTCMQATSIPSDIRDPLLALGKSLFARLLHSEASNFLETLDQEVSEDGWEYTVNCSPDILENQDMMVLFRLDNPPNSCNFEPSEYRVFLRETLTTLSTVINLVPEPLINMIVDKYHVAWNDYVNLIQSSDVLSSGGVVFQFRSQPLHRVHWILKDFSAITQTVGFIMESISSVASVGNSALTFSTPGILQSLIYCLHLNSQLVTALTSLKQSLIRSDIIIVIVENLMTLQSIVLGNYLTITDGSTNSLRGKIPLSAEQKNEFSMQVMQVIVTFLLPTSGIPSSVPIPVQVCSARLFGAITSSPLFSDFTASVSLDIISYMLDFLCDEKRRSLLPFDVLRILLRSFVHYLCARPLKVLSDTGDLERLISHCYSPNLTETVLQQDPCTYMLTLGLLNDAVEMADSLSSSARRLLQSTLTKCGLIGALVQCVSSNLARETHSSAGVFSAYTAYLTFFTTYIRVLSQASSTSATVPELLGRIIRALYLNAADSQCGSRIPACWADRILGMFLVIAKNRRLFVSLVSDILDLCVHRILPGLGLRHCAEVVLTDENLPELVCSAGLHSPGSMKVFCELLFAMLSEGFAYFFESKTSTNQLTGQSNVSSLKSDLFVNASHRYILIKPDAFNRVMIILTAVFHERQVSSSLITSTLDGFSTLHRLRKFFDLHPFNHCWLPELMHRLLSLLINKQHDSCKDVILSALHSLVLCGTLPNTEVDVNKTASNSKCSVFFVHYFLPAFFNTLPYVDAVEQSTILVHFYRSFQSSTSGVLDPENLIDLSDVLKPVYPPQLFRGEYRIQRRFVLPDRVLAHAPVDAVSCEAMQVPGQLFDEPFRSF
ncbi:hypothetical protein D915_004059 [Fasciola hepatica]|uniref:Importin N-terminal domain-containing protein n=1 Tax=Fasciola hepatica TaxID=6192 RepID=A0A4E0S1X4_FASHE|nr:hypothetical protein D915_004059 [Fasciola hepatica]